MALGHYMRENRRSPRVLPWRKAPERKGSEMTLRSDTKQSPKDERRKHAKRLSLKRLAKRFFSLIGKALLCFGY